MHLTKNKKCVGAIYEGAEFLGITSFKLV